MHSEKLIDMISLVLSEHQILINVVIG